MENKLIKNLQKGFGLSLFILLFSSVVSYFSIYKFRDRADWVNHTNIVLQQAENVSSLLNQAETEQRGYLLTGYDNFLQPFISTKQHAFASVDTLTLLTSDNPRQRVNCRHLDTLIQSRFSKLEYYISLRKSGNKVQASDLISGQDIMNKTRQVLANIKAEEDRLLIIRTESFGVYSWLTPLVLIISSLIAIIITLVFYRKIKRDYDLRLSLQKTLEKNDRDTAERIKIIEDVAGQVSSGNYKVRVSDREGDNLGRLASALNKMAGALDDSFEEFQKREWQKSGSADLNEKMIGEKDVRILSANVIQKIASYTGSVAAALYLCENDTLELAAGVALDKQSRKRFFIGEGLVGQCAKDKVLKVYNELPQNEIVVSYASGNIKPNNLVLFPVIWEDELEAVIELVSLTPYTAREINWFSTISPGIGTSVESAKRNARLKQLLGETQVQAEELQMQQQELEHLNSDLEIQAQKLQVSEEELKVQQEELLQANQELEERSTMLEEKNQAIVERNLEIQKKSEELETTTRYKSEFLTNMSHELRTPLNSILLLSRLLSENLDKNLNTEQIEFATVIQTSGNGLLTLIDEILDLSKIEAGKMKVEFRQVAMAEIVNNMNALFAPLAKQKNLAFSVEANEAPQQLITDSVRLEQILKNLLSNALKFTARGSVTMKISAPSANKIQFVVKDSGIGIPADKQHLVFEAFQQADGSTRRKYGGTGLGLSISRELAKLLGGEISLKSDPGEGSEFTLLVAANAMEQLPKANETAFYNSDFSTSTEQISTPVFDTPVANDVLGMPDDRENIKPGDKVILIVEDDASFAQNLLSYTRKNNYKGLVAMRGDYGVQLATLFLPTAILLDIRLPVKNGWQVMEELKANAATKHIPVHMMSSMQAKDESISRGAIDFIDKSESFEKLPDVFKRIEEALQRGPKKILIVEENEKHAQALCYFLESYNVNVKNTEDAKEAAKILLDGSADCVVLEMKVFVGKAYETLDQIKNIVGLEHLPIIIFTGKSLSKTEETRLRQVADSIVVKTANSYKRILDEIDIFLQIVAENDPATTRKTTRRLGGLEQVLENKTVLLVDDDIRNIYSLTKALEAHKMNVVTATDGKDGIEQLKQNSKINIVLMDMMMPEMDGYEATQAIRTLPQYRNLPILAITAKAMYGDREKCIQAGASDYISKPVDIDQLVSLLRVWLYQ